MQINFIDKVYYRNGDYKAFSVENFILFRLCIYFIPIIYNMSETTNQSAERIKKELLNKVLHHKGWLKKKSPALLKSWQERFFMITNNGK
jgi:hypothetical protein